MLFAAVSCTSPVTLCSSNSDCGGCEICQDGTCVVQKNQLNSCGLCGEESQCADAGGPAVGEWHPLQLEPRPVARMHSYCAYDGDHSVYVFGGVTEDTVTTRLNDVWRLDTNSWTWHEVWKETTATPRPFPNPRYAGSAVFYDNKLFAFGGVHALSGYDIFEIWALDLGTMVWRPIVESTRNGNMRSNGWFGSAEDRDTETVWFYGGMATTSDTSLETFLFSFNLRSELVTEEVFLHGEDHHYMVEGHSMVFSYKSTKPVLTVFGGVEGKSGATDAREETWEYQFDTKLWSNLPIPDNESPPDRLEHSMNMVSDNRALVFGGRIHYSLGAPQKDLWLFSVEDETWDRVLVTGHESPAARFGHCAVVLNNDTLVIFGGSTGSRQLNDTWFFVLP